MADILVPIRSDNRPPAEFRNLLRAYDPDYIAAYQATHGEVALADSGAYASWLAGKLGEAGATEEEAELRREFEAEVSRIPRTWDPSAAVEFTRSWCSPYRSGHGYFPVARKSTAIGSPLVPLSVFPGLLGSPRDLALDYFDPAFELMIRMRIGSLAEADLPRSARMRQAVAEDRDVIALSELACAKEVTHPPAMDSEVVHIRELRRRTVPTHGDSRSPFDKTTHGMSWINFEPRATWVVVVGDTCEDFCFALACDRIFLGATWLPARLVNDPLLTGGLAALRTLITSNATNGHRAFFTSLSLDLASVDESRQVALAADAQAADRCSTVAAPSSLAFGRPKRLGDPGSLYLGESSNCYRNEDGALNIATALSTPIPDAVRSSRPTEVAWEVDVNVNQEHPLPRSALSPAELLAMASQRETVDVRVGTLGLTHHSHGIRGIYLEGWILEQHLVRPVLRFPSVSTTIQRLADAGDYTVRPSQTGRLNQLVIGMWGSIEALAADLSGPMRKLLDVVTPSPDMKDGPLETSLVINRMPYITAENAQVLLNLDAAGTRAELDRLQRLGVLRRGFILRCARCHWLDWYAIDRIGQSFKCGRCDRDNLLQQERWRLPVLEPNWYYDLDHAVREALRLDGHVPILALDRLRTRHRESFAFSTDFELIKNGNNRPAEIDFAVIADGRLILGEAKKNDRLGSDREDEKRKLRHLCTVVRDLTADDVCLATAADQWDPGTVALADRAFAELGITPIYETALSAR